MEFHYAVDHAGPQIGATTTRKTNPLSPVLEYDGYGNEIMYRTISEQQFEHLQQTGVLLPTTETSISPSFKYASKYRGTTVRFVTAPGTSAELQAIGRAQNNSATIQFPSMSTETGPWMDSHVQFKFEKGQMTTQLGQGRGLSIFNNNIILFEEIPK